METVWIMEIKDTDTMEFDVFVFASEHRAIKALNEYIADVCEEDLVDQGYDYCEVHGKDGFNIYVSVYEEEIQ